MKNNNNAIIIGAGIGGITTGIYLAQQGYKVTIYEKNAYAGGRCGNFIKDGHRFDIGATMMMMPDIYERTYAAIGKSLTEELELYRIDPVYKIKFRRGEELLFSSDLAKLQKQLEAIEPGSYNKFLKYMYESYKSYQLSMKYIIDRNYYRFYDFFNLKNLLLLFKLRAFNNHYKHTCRYFKNELLRVAFTFQNIYVGQNPFEASAIFAMLPFLELTDGIWFPKGGMFKIIENLVSIAKEHNVKIQFNSPVKKIKVDKHKAEGIILENNSFHQADVLISNADLPYVYNELLPVSHTVKRINKLDYTCSAFVFHWGIDTVYPQLEQHTVFVSKNYKEDMQTIFHGKLLPAEPSFYLHSPVKSDETAAPKGNDSISVILPVGHIDNRKNQDWGTLESLARKAIIKRLSEEGMNDFEKHIKFEVCYTPQTWKFFFNLSRGATFGSLSHNIMQMGYLRPHNNHKTYRNLFFVGGSTHPGSGLPMSLISAKLTSEKIIKHFK